MHNSIDKGIESNLIEFTRDSANACRETTPRAIGNRGAKRLFTYTPIHTHTYTQTNARTYTYTRNHYFQDPSRECSKCWGASSRERSAFSLRTIKRRHLSTIETSRIRTTEKRGRTLGYDGQVGRCVSEGIEYRLADDSRGIELDSRDLHDDDNQWRSGRQSAPGRY